MERKSRIIHVAFHLFSSEGIDNVTIAGIAKASNVCPASVYRYFNTKAQLLFNTQKQLWNEVLGKLIPLTRGTSGFQGKNGYEQVKILIDGFEFFYQRNENYLMFAADYFLFLVRNGRRLSAEEYGEMLSPVENIFLDALKKGKADGSIAASESAEDIFLTIWGAMRGFVEKIVVYDRMYSGDNFWKSRFSFVRGMMLNAMKLGFQELNETDRQLEIMQESNH